MKQKPKHNFLNHWKPKPWKPVTFKPTVTFNQSTSIRKNMTRNFRKLDTDRDGVPNWRDCQPLNPWKQDVSKQELQKEVASFKRGIEKRKNKKEYNGFYIIKDKDGTYSLWDKATGYPVGYGRKSEKELIKDIPGILSTYGVSGHKDPKYKKEIRKSFEYHIEQKKHEKKYKGKRYRGFEKGKELVLDVGAGISPDWRATHAIDLRNPGQSWKGVKYKHGINLNQNDMPYSSSAFDRVISYGSLGFNFGTSKTYNEIYRILRIGGIVEIGLPLGSEKNIPIVTNALSKSGFRNIKKSSHKTPLGGKFTIISGDK